MATSETPLCSDEHVYNRVGGADYFAFFHLRSRVVAGSDGTLTLWTLSSGEVPLPTLGLVPGMVARLKGSGARADSPWLYATIEEVKAEGLLLRYAGEAANLGLPLASVVKPPPISFEIASCAGVTGQVSRQIRQKLKITSDAQFVSLTDPEAAAVAMSAAWLYFAAAKEATAAERDTYWTKYLDLKEEAELEYKILADQYNQGGGRVGDLAVFDMTCGCDLPDSLARCCPPGPTTWRPY